jgi:hypothetical protein
MPWCLIDRREIEIEFLTMDLGIILEQDAERLLSERMKAVLME